MDEQKHVDAVCRIRCTQCRWEVPLDEAISPEGVPYVIHFCGIDCYARWRKDAAAFEAASSQRPDD